MSFQSIRSKNLLPCDAAQDVRELIDSSRAVIDGKDIGPVGALTRQAKLNEFLIPQRGIFAVARAFLEAPSGVRVELGKDVSVVGH